MSRNFDNIATDYLTGPAPVTAVPFSMMLWFNSDVSNTGLTDVLASIGAPGTQLNSWHISIGTTAGRITLNNRDSATAVAVTSGAALTYSVGVWACALAVFSSNQSRAIYLNGGAKNTTNVTPLTPAGVTELRLGQNGAAGSPMDGRLAHFAVWNTALSDDDADMLGAQRMSPLLVRRDSLIAYYPRLGRNAGEIDIIGNQILTVNGTTNVTDEPPVLWRAGRRRIFLPLGGAAPSFDISPVIQSTTTTQYTLAATPSASATWYIIATKAGDTAPTAGQVIAAANYTGATVLASANKAITGADTLAVGGSLTRPYHDLHMVLNNGGGASSVVSILYATLTAPAGLQYQTVALSGALPTRSFLQGASPAAENFDLEEASLLSSPGNYSVQLFSDGLIELSAGGDLTRQTVTFRFWDKSLDAWSDATAITEYINDQPPDPVSGGVLSQNFTVDVSVPVFNFLTGGFTDAEGDTLTGSVISGSLPPGTAISVGGDQTGVPTSAGTGTFTFQATDVAGETGSLVVNWTVSDVPLDPGGGAGGVSGGTVHRTSEVSGPGVSGPGVGA